MKKKPLVSTIIPIYNRDKYIKRAIESVLNQAFKDLEIIIVDDSPDDKIANIVSKLSKGDLRIVYIKNKNRLGFVKSLNKGVSLAKGKYIARLDDDDFWCDSRKLEKQINFLEKHPEYILTGGGVIVVNEKNQEIRRCLCPETDEEIRQAMLFNCPFWHSTVVFRKDAWLKMGGYDEKFDFTEDWDLWLRFGKFKLGKFYNFPEYFAYFLEGVQNRTNLLLRQNLRLNFKQRIKYRKDYPHFYKAILLSGIRYFYFYLPFSWRQSLGSIVSRIKKLVLKTPF